MVADPEQHQPEVDTTYRLTRTGAEGRWDLHTRVRESDWTPWYAFDETPRELADFTDRNAFFQTDDASPFRQGPLATRSRSGGRVTVTVTVTGDRFVETVDGVRSERVIGWGFPRVDQPPHPTALPIRSVWSSVRAPSTSSTSR